MDNCAPIKAEYIDHDHKRRIAENIPSSIVEQIKENSAATSSSSADRDEQEKQENPPKRQKLKGRNKKRPIEKNPEAKDKLCPAVLSEKDCQFGDKCRYRHDIKEYLADKPPDLGDKCHNYETYGKCPYSVACRFGSQHISEDGKNEINIDTFEAMKGRKRFLNILEKDLQKKLWKKKYDFTRGDNECKRTKRELDERNTLQKADANKQVKQPCIDKLDEPYVNTKESSENDTTGDALQGNGKANSPKQLEEKIVDAAMENDVADETLKICQNIMIGAKQRDQKKMIDFRDKLYLAPLTTVGNLPFRSVCKQYGADITCGEMAMCPNILQGQSSEWALLKRHASEDIFGIQICGSYADTMSRTAQIVTENLDVDFIDINCGCPIDLVFKRGEGSALMGRTSRLEHIVKSMTSVMEVPLTIKMRTGIYEDKFTAHTLLPQLKNWGIAMATLHGRSREQRYTRMANWEYIKTCAEAASPMPLFGNGDILSYEDYYQHKQESNVSGIMIARGALIKPWIFKEIKERTHWDISASERLDMLRDFVNVGLEYWGSDQQGVTITRRFLLEWLSFLYRYIPVGLLERLPQRINEKPLPYFGRNDLETLMASPNCGDWVKISEMLLGPVPPGFEFLPKHKANSYK